METAVRKPYPVSLAPVDAAEGAEKLRRWNPVNLTHGTAEMHGSIRYPHWWDSGMVQISELDRNVISGIAQVIN